MKEREMSNTYQSTRDLCLRYRCSARTLFRRMKRPANPFPPPCMQHAGSFNLWDAGEVAAWELRERGRCHATSADGRQHRHAADHGGEHGQRPEV
jgi:hypothetical protein